MGKILWFTWLQHMLSLPVTKNLIQLFKENGVSGKYPVNHHFLFRAMLCKLGGDVFCPHKNDKHSDACSQGRFDWRIFNDSLNSGKVCIFKWLQTLGVVTPEDV